MREPGEDARRDSTRGPPECQAGPGAVAGASASTDLALLALFALLAFMAAKIAFLRSEID